MGRMRIFYKSSLKGISMDKNSTTIYKGIAILAIMMCHAAGYFGGGNITYFTPLGGIGVAIFFLLSAYGLNESWNKRIMSAAAKGEKMKKIEPCSTYTGGGIAPYYYWWRKRFITVWIPYIILQLIIYWPFHEFEFSSFILDLILIKPLYQNGWYLQYLFMWYVIFYTVRRIGFLDRHRVIIFIAVSVVCFFTLREIKAEQSLSFLLGIILSEKKDWQERLFRIKCSILLIVFGVICLAIKQLPVIRLSPQIIMNLVQLGVKLPVGFGLMILAFWMLKRIQLRGLYLVGIMSYELYLIHGNVLEHAPVSITGMVLFSLITAVVSIFYQWLMKKMKKLWFKVFRVTIPENAS